MKPPTTSRFPPVEGMELVVVAHKASAEHAGFRGQHHPSGPHIMAWWPGLGERNLPRGRVVSRVTIDSRVMLAPDVRDYLRAITARVPGSIWMEF